MRKIDRPTLTRSAEFHVARHPATRAGLVTVLRRKVAAHVRKTGEPAPPDVETMIADVVAALVTNGLVDDRRLAESRTRVMRARGKSTRAVRLSLGQKGVARELVDAVLEGERHEGGAPRSAFDADLEAARTLVRKKKLGAMRDSSSEAEMRAKDLAALGRAGFSYDVARRALADPHGDADI